MRLKSHVNYTSGLMTNRSGDVRLNERKKGPQARKGKAMLQTQISRMKNKYRLFDLLRTTMPAANDAEQHIRLQ